MEVTSVILVSSECSTEHTKYIQTNYIISFALEYAVTKFPELRTDWNRMKHTSFEYVRIVPVHWAQLRIL
jgi:hypothetical protein